jgi:hypothetical protein
VPGYVLFRKDRCDRQGGGVFLLIRDNLTPSSLHLPSAIDEFKDSIWCAVRICESKSLLIGCMYRSPSSSFQNDEQLVSLIDFVCQLDFTFSIIVGDFNCPEIDWKQMSSPSASQFLIDCTLDNFLTQLVCEPTRGDHILDLVFTNDVSLVSSVAVKESFPGSDHHTVHCSVTCDFQHLDSNQALHHVRHQLNFSKANWPLYRSILEQTDWNDVFSGESIDVIWDALKSRVFRAAQGAIPPRKPIKKVFGVPLTGQVRSAFRYRKQILRSLKDCTSKLACDLRARAEERLKGAIIDSRKSFERSVAEDSRVSPKRFWSYVRNSLASKPKITSIYKSDGAASVDDRDTAEAFMRYFMSVHINETVSNDPVFSSSLQSKTNERFNDFYISSESVSIALRSLSSFSSPGPDGMPNILLKEGGSSLIAAIVVFFRLLLDEGNLPSEWKLATVVPIYKKGSRSDCKNYRPISLTCNLCKVFERLLKDYMLASLLENGLLNSSQHGFLPGRSTSTALLSFLEELSSSLDDRKCADAIFLDFSKAFDTVPHKRLLLKLHTYGFGGLVLNWISAFLQNRQLRVKVGGSFSAARLMTSGVPQGSVLGPLLFVIFIDDIDLGLNSRVIKFADDIKLLSTFVTEVPRIPSTALLQNDLHRVSEWCRTWLLDLNLAKCSCVHFGYNNPEMNYYLYGETVQSVKSVTDLGVKIMATLKPSIHCLHVVSRAHRLLSTIKLAFRFLDVQSLTILYKSFVLPVLEYACVAWCPYYIPYYIKDIEALEKVQRRFTRILPDFRHLEYEDRLSKYNLTSLYARRLGHDLTLVFKLVRGFIDLDSSQFFNVTLNTRTRGHRYRIKMCHSRLDVRKYFFSNRIVSHWNSLPLTCVEATSVKSFKKALKLHFAQVGIR